MWLAALVAVLPVLPLAVARSAIRTRGLDPDVDAGLETYPYQSVVPQDLPYYESTLQPCPQLPLAQQLDVDELLGSWHLSLLLLADRTPEGQPLLDDTMCAAVEVTRTNASMLRLDWQLHQLGLPAGLGDVHLQVPAAILSQPALWALATPLGGEALGLVTHAAPRSHVVLTVCGAQHQATHQAQQGETDPGAHTPSFTTVHVLTALLTRRPPSALGSLALVRLSAHMMPANGFRRVDERLLSWGQC